MIHNLEFHEALSVDDLEELEAVFVAEGTTREELETGKKRNDGLGLLVRSLVGLDRQAEKGALSQFLNGQTLAAKTRLNLRTYWSTSRAKGWIYTAKLYSSSFTDIHTCGVNGLSDLTGAEQAEKLLFR